MGTNGTMIHFDGSQWSAIETGISSTLRAVWGGKPACTTGSKYGYRLKTVAIDYHQDGRSPPNMDSAQIAESIAHWIRQALDGGDFGDIGVISDCAPGSACDDDLQGILHDGFAQARAAGIAFEVEQVFDMVLDSLAQALPGRQIQPALVAYSVVKEAGRVFPGESLIDSGLMSQAIAWSLDRQGMRSKSLKNGRLDLHAELNFSHPKVGNRPRPGKNKAGALPGVDAPNTSGYPGFREPTEEELASVDALIEYVRLKRRSVEAYGARHRTELLLERIDVFDAILATDDGSDAQSAEQIAEMRQQLQVVAVELQAVSDFDQDQVRNAEDLCPEDCALGMDADLDGCVDEVCGLEEEVALLDAWWLPKMILGMRARLACLKSEGPGPSGHGHGHAYGHGHGNGLGPANAALAQLRVFLRQLSNYVRIGWIDGKQASALVDFAENSRDVLLGDFDDLECF